MCRTGERRYVNGGVVRGIGRRMKIRVSVRHRFARLLVAAAALVLAGGCASAVGPETDGSAEDVTATDHSNTPMPDAGVRADVATFVDVALQHDVGAPRDVATQPDTSSGGPPADAGSASAQPTCGLGTRGCRCELDSPSGTYVIACTGMFCVCDLNMGATITTAVDTVEASCAVMSSGAWPGSTLCGYPLH